MTNPSAADLYEWGSPVERERNRRIRLTLYAYAYEVHAAPLVSDAEFDALSQCSRPDIRTGRFDDWWRREFQPQTGMWIRSHPDLQAVENYYRRALASVPQV